jgi:serine/threonine-protein kinase
MPQPGESLGKYTLVRRIGLGGMAEVWLARVTGPGGFSKKLVLKTVLEHHAQNQDFIAQFLDEARLAALLDHPNIAQIFELGLERGVHYIAMEYVRGKDLHDVIERSLLDKGGLPYPYLARMACGVCAGLHYAHELVDEEGGALSLVHRDISPENILVSYDGVTKLVDFGIAKASINQVTTRAGLFKGKLQFAAPQRFLNQPQDRRDDIYSLGAVLYRAVAGVPSVDADSDGALIKKILDGEFSPPRLLVPELPQEFETIILKCMAWDAQDRYQTARAVQEDLEQFIVTSGPAVTAFELSEFMKDCFAQDIAHEKVQNSSGHLTHDFPDSFDSLAAPTAGPGSRRAPSADATQKIGHSDSSMAGQPFPTDWSSMSLTAPGAVRNNPLLHLIGLDLSNASDFAGVQGGGRRLSVSSPLRLALLLVVLSALIGGGALWGARKDSALAQSGGAASAQAGVAENGPTGAYPANSDGTGSKPSGVSPSVSQGEPAVAEGADASSQGGDEAPAAVVEVPPAASGDDMGTLSLRGPDDCVAKVGGSKLGRLPLKTNLPAGEQRVRLRCARGVRRVVEVNIVAGEVASETIRIGEGTLLLLVRPWAEVFINGRRRGITPLGAIRLREGRHTLRLVNDDIDVTKRSSVIIRPGKQTKLRFRLR